MEDDKAPETMPMTERMSGAPENMTVPLAAPLVLPLPTTVPMAARTAPMAPPLREPPVERLSYAILTADAPLPARATIADPPRMPRRTRIALGALAAVLGLGTALAAIGSCEEREEPRGAALVPVTGDSAALTAASVVAVPTPPSASLAAPALSATPRARASGKPAPPLPPNPYPR